MSFPVKHPHLPSHLVDISMQKMGSGTGISMQMGQEMCGGTSASKLWGCVPVCVQKIVGGKMKGEHFSCTKKLTFPLESILAKILILSGSQCSVRTVWIPCLLISPSANESPAL